MNTHFCYHHTQYHRLSTLRFINRKELQEGNSQDNSDDEPFVEVDYEESEEYDRGGSHYTLITRLRRQNSVF